jgi:hypothetical protein
MPKTVEVKVEKDHLDKLAGARKLSAAIAELIWNAVDADATDVRIDYVDNGLGALREVTVTDNAPKGMPYDRALVAFERLGGSWKKSAIKTETEGRALHGKEGVGRFRAFALGDYVEWRSVFVGAHGKRAEYTVTGSKAEVKRFHLSDPRPTTASPGTTVTISNSSIKYDTFDKEEIAQDLAEHFAFYLRSYPHVKIMYGARRVDPKSVISREETIEFNVGEVPAKLTIIEWNRTASRALVFCDEDGFALSEMAPGIVAPGFDFTAYLRSPRLTALHCSNRLE